MLDNSWYVRRRRCYRAFIRSTSDHRAGSFPAQPTFPGLGVGRRGASRAHLWQQQILSLCEGAPSLPSTRARGETCDGALAAQKNRRDGRRHRGDGRRRSRASSRYHRVADRALRQTAMMRELRLALMVNNAILSPTMRRHGLRLPDHRRRIGRAGDMMNHPGFGGGAPDVRSRRVLRARRTHEADSRPASFELPPTAMEMSLLSPAWRATDQQRFADLNKSLITDMWQSGLRGYRLLVSCRAGSRVTTACTLLQTRAGPVSRSHCVRVLPICSRFEHFC